MGTTDVKPGLHYDVPNEEYHAQTDWLSASGIKRLIPPSTPAHFKAAMDEGEDHKPAYDIGKAFHAKVLGAGEDVLVVDADSWRTKDARLARDAAYETGRVPILAAENEVVEKMAASVREHPIASLLFGDGEPEVSAFWTDPATGVQCRARFDWLPESIDGKRLIVPDLKSAFSAAPTEFERASARLAYYVQQEHYRDALVALDIDPDPAFLFVVVEKESPYLVSVNQFTDREDVKLARAAVDRARRIYAECVAADEWPGYPAVVNNLSLPNWLHINLEEYVAS